MNFLENINKMVPRKWACPICKVKIFDMFVDGYLDSILKELRNNNQNPIEIIYKRCGGYQVIYSNY